MHIAKTPPNPPAPPLELATATELVARARANEADAFREIMRRNNRRLFRLARSILRDDGEAEDAVQDAYLGAFLRLDAFRGDSALSTWLSRIVINEALGRLRARRAARRTGGPEMEGPDAQVIAFPGLAAENPEQVTAQREILRVAESAIDALPMPFRAVFVARVLEDMSIEETAALLETKPATVKTQLHRARQMLREDLDRRIGAVLTDTFPFAGRRCQRLTDTVLARLALK